MLDERLWVDCPSQRAGLLSTVLDFSSSVLSPARLLPKKLVIKGGVTERLSRRLAEFHRGRGMLIAIDASVDHGDALAAGAISGAKVLMLDPQTDAIAQIAREMCRVPFKYQSLHVVTHGSPGCLHFSSGDVSLANLDIYAEQIDAWFGYRPARRGSKVKVKNPESFLSLYACSLATGDAGTEFLERLHYLAGVSVHASRGKVGSTALDGSWHLEVAHPFPHTPKFPFTDDLLETYEAVLSGRYSSRQMHSMVAMSLSL